MESIQIVPSLASASQANILSELRRVEAAGAKKIHLDIEDGNFINNITFGIKMVSELRQYSNLAFNIHLMVTNPINYLTALKQVDNISVFFQVEAVLNPIEVLAAFRQVNIPAGLAFLPITPLEPYYYILKKVNEILIMTSEPDGMGQCFIEEMLLKIKVLADHFPRLMIWADGDINQSNADRVIAAGVRNIVMGREVFQSPDIRKTLDGSRFNQPQ